MKRSVLQTIDAANRRKGFLQVPHYLLDDLYSEDEWLSSKALISLCFLKHVYFTEGPLSLNGRCFHCGRGEWYTTLRQLERMTGIARRSIPRVLEQLNVEGHFYIRQAEKHTFVRLVKPLVLQEEVPEKKPAASSNPLNLPNYKRLSE